MECKHEVLGEIEGLELDEVCDTIKGTRISYLSVMRMTRANSLFLLLALVIALSGCLESGESLDLLDERSKVGIVVFNDKVATAV